MVRDFDLNPDHARGEDLGFDESIYCAGKSADQVRRILQGVVDTDIPLQMTRLECNKVARLPDRLGAGLGYEAVSRIERNTHRVD